MKYMRFYDFPTMFSYAVNMIGSGEADHLYLYSAYDKVDDSISFVLSSAYLRHFENKYEKLVLTQELVRGGE